VVIPVVEQPDRQSAREELAAAAKAVVAGAVDPLEGAVEVYRRWRALITDDLPYEELAFLMLMSVDSEMDRFPTSRDRALWASDSLAKADEELAAMRAHYRDDILHACQRVAALFESTR
jgi:hypothetical protein